VIWALLAILGVPIWLIVGALAAVLVSRRRFLAQPEVFKLKLRPVDGEKWPRRNAYGRLVHDVLILNSGPALVRTTVRGVKSAVERPADEEIPGFDQPTIFELAFDDGPAALVAVDRSAASSIQAIIQATQ
jgi:hypothetical protein